MARQLTPEQKLYNTQSLLCDQFWEFHRDIFDELSPNELRDLLAYYPQDLSSISDVFEYRDRVLAADPTLGSRAQSVLKRVLGSIGVRVPKEAEE